MDHSSPRRQRQIDELTEMCRAGAIGRAIDLAFEHVARFGDDPDVLRVLTEAMEQANVPPRARRRFAELRTRRD